MRPNKQQTILFAGRDDRDVSHEIKKLESFGYHVLSANSGEKALEIVALIKDIDLLLMPVHPDREAEDLSTASNILEIRDIPVVFQVSASHRDISQQLGEIRHYGCIPDDAGDEVLKATIQMAFRLFHERQVVGKSIRKVDDFQRVMQFALDHSWASVLILDKKLDVIYANQNFINDPRPQLEPVAGQNYYELFPDLDKKWKDLHQRVLNGEKLSSEKDTFIHRNGTSDWIHWEARPWYDQDDEVGGIVFYSEIITEQIPEVEEQSKEVVSGTDWINHMNEALWIVDFEGNLMAVNQRALEQSGYSSEELIPDGLPLLDPVFGNLTINQFSGSACFETTQETKNGTVLPVEISISRVTYEGQPAVMSIAREISIRKKKEEQLYSLLNDKDIQLKETNHRVKNNLSVLHSLLKLESDAHDDPLCRNTLEDAAARIYSMVVLYDLLYRTDMHLELNVRDYLPAIIEEVVKVFEHKSKLTTKINIESFTLSAKILSTMGILINELCTNTIKYAFPDMENPEIGLSVSKKGNTVTIVYSDNGVGLPESVTLDNSQSFGLRLVKVLTAQLNGKLQVDREGGTTFTISFELKNHAQNGSSSGRKQLAQERDG